MATPLSVHGPQDLAKGGVVVVQEAFGVTAHIEDVCARLAAEGWLAVAPHLYHRGGDPTFGYHDLAGARELMAQFTPEGILEDFDAAIDHLASAGIPMRRIGVVGFCMGGSVSLVATARRDIGAGVGFYGGGIHAGRFGFDPLAEEATRLRAPWLGLYGDLDPMIPVDDIEDLRRVLDASPHETEIVRYADAGHGFNCDQRDDFHEPSARDAWARALAWFDRHLAG